MSNDIKKLQTVKNLVSVNVTVFVQFRIILLNYEKFFFKKPQNTAKNKSNEKSGMSIKIGELLKKLSWFQMEKKNKIKTSGLNQYNIHYTQNLNKTRIMIKSIHDSLHLESKICFKFCTNSESQSWYQKAIKCFQIF